MKRTVASFDGGYDVEMTSDEVIDRKLEEMQAKKERDATAYIDKRVSRYGNVESQLDEIYWDMVNGTTTWVDRITKIKEQFPKP